MAKTNATTRVRRNIIVTVGDEVGPNAMQYIQNKNDIDPTLTAFDFFQLCPVRRAPLYGRSRSYCCAISTARKRCASPSLVPLRGTLPRRSTQRFDFSPIPSGRSNGQHPRSLDTLLSKGTRLARALTMRVYEAKMVYSLVSLGEDVVLDSPSQIAEYLHSAFEENPMQEAFYCVYLDRKNHPLGRHLITLGTATGTLVSPKEVFRGAIVAGAVAIVVAHNHPSGDPAPSSADIRVTRALREAARILEIELLDHVICGEPKSDPRGRGFHSFREAGQL